MFRRSTPCLLLFALALTGCERVAETVGPPVKMTPAGTPPEVMTTNDIAPANAQFMSAKDLAAKADVPTYPGAIIPEGASNIKQDAGQARYELVMSTTDMPESVLKFYRGTLKNPSSMPGETAVMGMTRKGYFASVTAVRSGNKTNIDVVVKDEKAGKG